MAEDVQSFEFKPALMRGRNNWTLDAGFLTRNGELFCSLANVTRVRFAQMSVRQTHSAWLDLGFEGGRHRIACNMPPGDENAQQFLSLTEAVMDDLSHRKPGLQVAIGAGGGVRWAMFLIGLAALVFGLFMILVPIMGGTPRDEALYSILIGAGFALFGAAFGWSYRPWAPPLTLSVGAARDVIAKLALNSEPQPGEGDGEDPEENKG